MKSGLHRILFAFLFAAAVLPASVLRGQSPTTPETPVGLSYVPQDAILVAQIRIDRLLQTPQVQQQAVEVVTAFGQKYLGFDPMKITGLTIVVAPHPEWARREVPESADMVQVFAVVKTSETLNEETFFARVGEVIDSTLTKEELAEQYPGLKGAVFLIEDPPLGYVTAYMVDPNTFLLGSITIANVDPPAELTAPAKQFAEENQGADAMAILHLGPLRDIVNNQTAEEGLPTELEPYRDIPNDADSLIVRLNSQEGFSADLKVEAMDEAAAKRLEKLATSAIEAGREKLLAPAHVRLESDDEMTVAVGKYQARVVNALFDKLQPTRDGKSLSLQVNYRNDNPNGWDHAIAGVLASILLPEVEEPKRIIDDNDTP